MWNEGRWRDAGGRGGGGVGVGVGGGGGGEGGADGAPREQTTSLHGGELR